MTATDWMDEFVGCLDVVDNQELQIEQAFTVKNAHLPTSIFKFRAVNDDALRNLADGTVWLAAPDSYNDPFDCVASLSAMDVYRAAGTTFVSEALRKARAHLPKADWAAIDASANPMREFGRRMLESDPSLNRDAIPKFLDVLDDMAAKDAAEAFSPLLDLVRGGIKLCSFSASREPIVMWSHYADEHRGFCIEYAVADLPSIAQRLLFPIIYREEIFDSTKFHLEAACRPERFNNIYSVLQAIYKAPDWKYEQEWRLVFSAGIIPEPRAYELGKPKAVYLGARMLDAGERRVRLICDELQIPMYRMRLAKGRFALDAEPISPGEV